MFRVAGKHTDAEHPDGELFQYRDPCPDQTAAEQLLERAIDEPEFATGKGEYTFWVEQLVPVRYEDDDAGQPTPVEHTWEPV